MNLESMETGAGPSTHDGVRCDFCDETVTSVRRVALDGDYERLRTPHRVLYACAPCSAKKENERVGLVRR